MPLRKDSFCSVPKSNGADQLPSTVATKSSSNSIGKAASKTAAKAAANEKLRTKWWGALKGGGEKG